MKALVIEDEKQIAQLIKQGLIQSGFSVDVCNNGSDGFDRASTSDYDILVVDLMLPGMDGLSIITELRGAGNKTPILILSAKRSVDDRIKGLRTGGDDYLTKPFSFAELLARVDALLRRATPMSGTTSLRVGDLTMDLLSREVKRAGKVIELRPKERSLLEYFMRHPGQVLSKTMILEHLWEYDFDPRTNVVDVLVHRLRGKLDKGFNNMMIQTLRGMGFALKSSENSN